MCLVDDNMRYGPCPYKGVTMRTQYCQVPSPTPPQKGVCDMALGVVPSPKWAGPGRARERGRWQRCGGEQHGAGQPRDVHFAWDVGHAAGDKGGEAGAGPDALLRAGDVSQGSGSFRSAGRRFSGRSYEFCLDVNPTLTRPGCAHGTGWDILWATFWRQSSQHRTRRVIGERAGCRGDRRLGSLPGIAKEGGLGASVNKIRM